MVVSYITLSLFLTNTLAQLTPTREFCYTCTENIPQKSLLTYSVCAMHTIVSE